MQKATVVLDVKADSGLKSIRQMKTEMRALQEAMTLAGKVGDEKLFKKLEADFAKLRNDLKDTQQAMQYLDPGELLGGWVRLTQGLVGSFAAVTGAMTLFGGESEKIQEIERKSMALIQTMMGLEQARQLLIDEGGIKQIKILMQQTAAQYKLISARLTENLTIKATENATRGAKVAQWLWNAAIAANPIVAITIGVAALTAGIYLLIKAQNKQTDAQRHAKLIQDSYNKANMKAIESTREQVVRVKALEKVATNDKLSTEKRTGALKELNAIMGTNLKLTDDIKKKVMEWTEVQLDQARITSLIQEIASLETELLNEQKLIAEARPGWFKRNVINPIISMGSVTKEELNKARWTMENYTEATGDLEAQITGLTNKLNTLVLAMADKYKGDQNNTGATFDAVAANKEYMATLEKIADYHTDVRLSIAKTTQALAEQTKDAKKIYEAETTVLAIEQEKAITEAKRKAQKLSEDLKTAYGDPKVKAEKEKQIQEDLANELIDIDNAYYVKRAQSFKKWGDIINEQTNRQLDTQIMQYENAANKTKDIQEKSDLEIKALKVKHIKDLSDLKREDYASEEAYNAAVTALKEKQAGEIITIETDTRNKILWLKLDLKAELAKIDEEMATNEKSRLEARRATLTVEYEKAKQLAIEQYGEQSELVKKLEEQFLYDIAMLESESMKQRITNWGDFSNEVAMNLSTIMTNLTDIELEEINIRDAAWQKSFDLRTAGFETELAKAEEIWGKESAQYKYLLGEQRKADEEKLKHDQWVEEQRRKSTNKYAKAQIAMQMAQATAELAKSTASIWFGETATKLEFGIPFAIMLQSLITGIYATQMALMSKQMGAIGKMRYGGFITGPSHESGGVRKELEGGEAVVNKRSMAIPGMKNLVSKINEVGGGVSFRDNRTEPELIDYDRLATLINDKRVYVVESDITDAQSRVKVIKDRTSF
jgi:hypothetical protein